MWKEDLGRALHCTLQLCKALHLFSLLLKAQRNHKLAQIKSSVVQLRKPLPESYHPIYIAITAIRHAKPESVVTEQMWYRAVISKFLGDSQSQSHLKISAGPLCLPVIKLLSENTTKQLQNTYYSLRSQAGRDHSLWTTSVVILRYNVHRNPWCHFQHFTEQLDFSVYFKRKKKVSFLTTTHLK